jgi:hypothetical protein
MLALVPVGFLLVGLGLLGAALLAAVRYAGRVACWESATGVVVERVPEPAGSVCGFIRVEFPLGFDGRVRFTAGPCWNDERGLRVGQEVQVLYPPGDPARAMLAADPRPRATPLGLALLGLLYATSSSYLTVRLTGDEAGWQRRTGGAAVNRPSPGNRRTAAPGERP